MAVNVSPNWLLQPFRATPVRSYTICRPWTQWEIQISMVTHNTTGQRPLLRVGIFYIQDGVWARNREWMEMRSGLFGRSRPRWGPHGGRGCAGCSTAHCDGLIWPRCLNFRLVEWLPQFDGSLIVEQTLVKKSILERFHDEKQSNFFWLMKYCFPGIFLPSPIRT